MDIPPVIPDGYNGPIKQLTCRICKHIFYLTKADYGRTPSRIVCKGKLFKKGYLLG
jgi:hypothetical protein